MGGLYLLKEDDDVNSIVARLTRKIEAMEIQKENAIKPDENIETVYGISECNTHLTKDYRKIPSFQKGVTRIKPMP